MKTRRPLLPALAALLLPLSSFADTAPVDGMGSTSVVSNGTRTITKATTSPSNCASQLPAPAFQSQSSQTLPTSIVLTNAISAARKRQFVACQDSKLIECKRYVVKDILVPIFSAIIGAIVGAFAIYWLTNRRDRDVGRNVARAVIYSLQREVETGLEIIEDVKSGVPQRAVGTLPSKGWEALQSLLSDRSILDAIIRYGRKGKVHDEKIGSKFGGKAFEVYDVEEILSHVKNYFCYIIPNFQNIRPDGFSNPKSIAEIYVGAHNVNLTLKKILNGLSQ